MIDHGPLVEPLLQSIRAWKVRFYILHCRLAFVAKQKFQFAKLDGLKPRSRLQTVAKARKTRGCHRFEDVDLTDQRLHDRPGAFEGMNRAEEIARRKILFDLLELVKQLLEPKLVSLMDDDEQHLIVLRRR